MKELLEKINSYSATTIHQLETIPESHLSKIIAGQLRETIRAHGDISKEHIGSASKRITNSLLGELK